MWAKAVHFLCFIVVSGVLSRHVTEDVFMPADCESIAKSGDHLLLEYSVHLADGAVSHSLKSPHQLYHIILDQNVSLFAVQRPL